MARPLMTDLPLVTVVTPSFNQARYLRQTIESVLSQDYPRIEYIVMDGGSTDGSVDIIRGFESRLSHWQSGPDRGQAHAVNEGWRHGRGDILAFLNSDDYYLPGAIHEVVQAFLDAPAAGLVFGQGNWVAEDGSLRQTTAIGGTAQQMVEGLTSVPQPAAFIRRTVIERVGWLDESLHFTLDKEFYLRVIGTCAFVVLDRPLACLRLQPDSKSVSSGASFAPEMIALGERIATHPDAYPLCRVDPRAIRARANQSAAQFLYMAGRYRDAVRHLGTALRLSPSAERWRMATHELPRLALRAAVGAPNYLRLSGAVRRHVRARVDGR